MHDENDVALGSDIFQFDTIARMAEIGFEINSVISVDNLKRLTPARRKCRFFTEPDSKYFNIYTENLCKMNCRINAAIALCKCRPFFYSVGNFSIFFFFFVAIVMLSCTGDLHSLMKCILI